MNFNLQAFFGGNFWNFLTNKSTLIKPRLKWQCVSGIIDVYCMKSALICLCSKILALFILSSVLFKE